MLKNDDFIFSILKPILTLQWQLVCEDNAEQSIQVRSQFFNDIVPL